MFTGIIRHLSQVQSVSNLTNGRQLEISTPMAAHVNVGDSVAVNGACLTVVEHSHQTITFRLMQETLKRTNLGQLQAQSTVNLERPLTPAQAIDGHFVMGHIDGLAEVKDIRITGQDKIFTFQPATSLMRFLVPQGSVALDGVSLTVVDVKHDNFTVSIMPYTLEHTLFGQIKSGYQANIEVDMLGKYVVNLSLRYLEKR